MNARGQVDRDVLLLVLASQVDLIDIQQLRAAIEAWTGRRERSIGAILVEQGVLTEAQRLTLEAMVDAHVTQHGGDPRRSLESLSSVSPLIEDLARLTEVESTETLTYLQRSGSDSLRPPPDAERAGPEGRVRVGGERFRVLRLHRRGGMGEVYAAIDEELGRVVALKEMQDRYANHPDARARFVLEAEITGNLEHPNIVPVYGLGAYRDGSPFYAMRFVEGDSLRGGIGRYHAELPALDRTERRVRLRQLLGRFLDVCDAMEYAHSRGVLHRDLKPSNIMLGRFGETLIVDWGLAKATGRSESGPLPSTDSEGRIVPSSASSLDETVTGQVRGTPGYMSPEQARGEVDRLGTTTDVYSLGAILYALLTGTRPGSELAETEVEPGPGSVVAPARGAVPAPLRAVCRKAMAECPEDRYPTARALAADVERWLADEPVSVYRDPLSVRLTRWGRRNRTLVASATALGLTAIVALAIGLWRVAEEEQRTRQQFLRAEAQRKRAEANVQNLVALSGRVLELSEEQLSQIDGAQEVRKAMFQEVTDAHERLLAEYPEESRLKLEAAHVRGYLANVQRLMNELEPARASYGRSVALLEERLEAEPGDRDARDRLAEILGEWAALLSIEGKLADAVAMQKKALALARAQSGEQPENTNLKRTIAGTLTDLGDFELKRGKAREAVDALREAVALYRGLLQGRDEPLHPLDPLMLTMAQFTGARAERQAGDLAAARRLHTESVERARALVAASTEDPNARYVLGDALLGQAETEASQPESRDRALGLFGEAVSLWVKLRADFSAIPVYAKFEALTRIGRSKALREAGRLEAAEADLMAAEAAIGPLVAGGDSLPEYREILGELRAERGRLALLAGDVAGAQREFDAAMAELRAAQAASPEDASIADRLRQAKADRERGARLAPTQDR